MGRLFQNGRVGTNPNSCSRVLLTFSRVGDIWDEMSAHEGCAIFGSPGSGKSSASGRHTALAFLRAGMGGLVTTTKPGDADDWRQYAQWTGRESDLVIFSPESGHMFDPIWYEFHRPGRGAGDVEALVQLFSTLMNVGSRKQTGNSQEPFWERAAEQLTRFVLVLLSLSDHPVSISTINDVVQSLPEDPEQAETPQWQETAFCAQVLESIRARKATLTNEQWNDLQQAGRYVGQDWPTMDPRPRSSVKMTFSGMADRFLVSPFSRMFCSGKCSVFPEDTYMQGKIIVLDLPIKLFGESGRFAQILFKLIWMRALE